MAAQSDDSTHASQPRPAIALLVPGLQPEAAGNTRPEPTQRAKSVHPAFQSFWVDYYDLLGFDQDATIAEIQKHWEHKQRAGSHPDKGGSRNYYDNLQYAQDILCN